MQVSSSGKRCERTIATAFGTTGSSSPMVLEHPESSDHIMPTAEVDSSEDKLNGSSNLNLASDLRFAQEIRGRDRRDSHLPGGRTNLDAMQHHQLVDMGAEASNIPLSGAGPTESGQQRRASGEDEEGRAGRVTRPAERVARPFLRKREAMSDLWQNQSAFRANRHRMRDMFQELREEVLSPANVRKSKAEIGDIFAFSSRGLKQIMRGNPCEDRIAIQTGVAPTIDTQTKTDLDIQGIDSTPFSLFAVFDGHGGTACAEFLMKSVSTVLAHSPVLYDEDLEPFERRACATVDAFAELEKVHNQWAHENRDTSGSTAILSTFQDGVLIMAGVGDSAALFVDHLGNTDTLCPMHSTKNAQEVQRVERMGGTIINGRVWGKLVPTRTIGDLDCKQEALFSSHGTTFSLQTAIESPVSPHPELKLTPIYAPPDDGEYDEPFLVLASDGLWDVFSNERVANQTRKGLRKLREHQANEARRRAKAEKKAEKLRDASIKGRESFLSKITRPRSSSSLGDLGSTGHSSNFARFTSSRSSWSGPMDEYLDLSLREVLDVSVRGGRGATPSAILDLNQYRGASADTGEGHASSISSESTTTATEDRALPPQRGVFNSTAETTSLRTAGLKSHNVAEQLGRMAKGARSMDDISIIVVTFKGGKDKGAPGSKGPQGKGAPVSVEASL